MCEPAEVDGCLHLTFYGWSEEHAIRLEEQLHKAQSFARLSTIAEASSLLLPSAFVFFD